MNGLINLPKLADVDFVASLTVALAGVSAMFYLLAAGLTGSGMI